ncbi:vacuolar transporter chaperone [Haplosporangium sp. Z 11]|nr:vacuolar transporter chaperone [Haplosporangium sp. Z 11]
MKFGTQLKAQRTPHWKYHFVDYDGLKALLKSKSHGREFTEQDEAQFVKQLNAELEKVASFQAMKLGEVQRRTEHCEFTIQQHQLPSGKSCERLTLSSFVETESEINKITQDLQDLARFQRLNYTAFLKIVKKHDKHTGFTLRPHFMNQQLNNHPFHKESFASLVGRLSTLYNIVRTGTAPAVTRTQSIDSEEDEELVQSGCIPKKTVFWVHPDCMMDVKMLILKYLPMVVYEPTPAQNSSLGSASQLSSYLTSESPVSTIYLDNQDFDLYMAQVEYRERSETVRLRWYGNEKKHMWVEHQQKSMQSASSSNGGASSSTTTSSTAAPASDEPVVTKHRFQIKTKYVPKLVQGVARTNKVVEQLRRSGQKTEQEIQQFEEATRLVQSRIKKRGLQPVTQTFFNRTAFQVPGDARVRITIDTDVVMVREKSIQTSDLYDRPWHPTELLAENYPFSHIREQDIVRFPYAIMQIRTMTEPQEEVPSWVDHISQSHLVEMVPNFAKDQHAIATLYESRVNLLPFWLSDMDRDIRKPMMLTGGFPRRSTTHDSNSNSGSNDTLTSSRSTDATTISDAGSPHSGSASKHAYASGSSKKQSRSRKSIMESQEIYTPNVTFHEEVQDLMAINRMMIENQNQGAASLSTSNNTADKKLLAPKKPVVSCLKKHGSFSSLQTRHSANEYSPQSPGEGYGSASSSASCSSLSPGPRGGRRKRVTFKKSTARRWLDKAKSWIPFMGESEDHLEVDDLEAQYHFNTPASSTRPKKSFKKLFWSGLSTMNISLLFIGLVLALMNLGDSVGLEAASMFLVVSCLCMGTTVWAHLIRMEGGNSDEEGGYFDAAPYITNTNKYKADERTGLLATQSKDVHESLYLHASHRGQWVRTRLLPVVTFLSLATAVGLNAVVRMRPISEDIGSGAD